jgi:endopeptidase La
MTEEIKKYKLYFLQSKYNKIIEMLNEFENHYNELIINYLIDNQNNFSNMLYDTIKNLNSYYNNTINYYLENETTDIDNFVKNIIDINSTNNNTIIKLIESYSNKYPSAIFKETEEDIKNLLKQYGYNNLNLMIEYLFAPNYFDKSVIDYINEINNIVIPVGYSIINNSNNYSNSYFWKTPSKFNNHDILNKKRELWLKLKNNNYMCINLYFKIDKFSCKSKTSQIKSPILQKTKTNIMSKLENYGNTSVDIKFLKSFLRHDYLGNIYCLTEIEYCDYIIKMYQKYTKLIDSTFVNIMREFVNQENIKKMFEIIFLLLLGPDESVDIAGLLIGLVKEKKNNKLYNVFDIIHENMTYYMQSKIKKSNINIKNSIEKLKSTVSNNIDDIDYKKQLIINKNIPENVKGMVLEKIEEMKSFNNEYYKQLLYVKTILNFPWSSSNDDLYYENLKNNNKQAIEYLSNIEYNLNNSCYGHEEAKKLLIQMIGKWISNPNSMGTSFGLVGPPGVGKTLLAKSVSKALDIPFGQITLGGQNDGEILHGHGYTYSGSQPGMIIKKMVEMGKSRCILYFDELDKACSKHGTINEITSILIHLTDPNMNKTFQDRFFQGIEFPLDKVIMIFSYNDSSKVDPILLDRLKEIKVSPYTMEDKLNICSKHIIKEMAENVNLDNINIDEDMIRYLIDNYTNEAGVRDIKRKIEDIFMHLNIEKIYNKGLFQPNVLTKFIPEVSQKSKKNKQINKNNKIYLSKDKIIEILKEPDTVKRFINETNQIGIINGLYATTNGDGGIIPIQIYPNMQHSKDKYEVRLTGKQGETMKESVLCSLTTAIEWLKHSIYKDQLENLMNTHVKNGFHVHTPDGATPKDGPSAGCAFTCAFISRILNKPIKNNIAMTGEIELTGKISKIGGLEFKLQGAKKAGVNLVYVPFENKKNINDIKKKYINLIDNKFEIKMVSHINDIINEILE